MGVQHSFEKMKPQLCFFLKKPSLVIYASTEFLVYRFFYTLTLYCCTVLVYVRHHFH